MNKDVIRQWANMIAVILTVLMNGLANALPLNGQLTGDISDRFDVFFVPAGYVFSIWGIIYLGLFAFGVYQGLPAQRANPRLRSVGYLFVFSCFANIIWLFMWHYNLFAVSFLVMLALLALLVMIYQKLEIGVRAVSTAERWLVQVPFSIYLGWISVATIANATDVLDYIGWSGWGIAPEIWAVIMLVIACGLAGLMTWKRRDIAYLLVLIWAFIGIALKQADIQLVAYAAWGAALFVAGLVIFSALKPKKLIT